MNRLTAMLERLPPPYEIGPGSLLHDVLAQVDLHLRVFDEEMDRCQRSHWVDHAFDRADLAKLGALFGVAPAPWEPDRLFRGRLKATIAALLRGAVGRAQLERVLALILQEAESALGVEYFDVDPSRTVFPTEPGGPAPQPAFVEFPARKRRSPDLGARRGVLRPLDTFTVVNDGIEPTRLELALTGVAGGRTAMPVLVNLANGSALGYRGVVAAGSVLVVRAADDGLTAELDGADVSDRMASTQAFVPGGSAPEPDQDDPPQPVRLERGTNTIWFVSQARYDDPGLDAALFAIAGDAMHQGRFGGNGNGRASGGGTWDDAVFFQPPGGGLDAWWEERAPATFRFEVPAGVVRREAGRRPDPAADHDALFRLMGETVRRLRAAAVTGTVAAVPLRETQRATDRIAVLAPTATQEEGSPGRDELAGIGARFDTTARSRSRYD